MPEIIIQPKLNMSTAASDFDSWLNEAHEKGQTAFQQREKKRQDTAFSPGAAAAYKLRLRLAQQERLEQRAAARQEESALQRSYQMRVRESRREKDTEKRDQERKQAAEESAMRRSYQARIQNARREQQETARIQDQSNRERERQRQGMIRGGARVAAAGVAVGTALTLKGYQNTVEGGRFDNEMHMLERELAGVFKPIQTWITRRIHGLNRVMRSLTSGEQDLVMIGGLAAAGATAYAGSSFVRGVAGRVLGGASGTAGAAGKAAAAGGALAGRGSGMLAGASRFLGPIGAAIGVGIEANGYANDFSEGGEGTWGAIKRYGRGVVNAVNPGYWLSEGIGSMFGGSSTPRRAVTDNSTVGYGAAGSTAELLQEDILRSGLGNDNGGGPSVAENTKAMNDSMAMAVQIGLAIVTMLQQNGNNNAGALASRPAPG